MTASFMGVNIDPTTVKDGSLKGSFDPLTHPQTRGFGATVVTGTSTRGALLGPNITSAVKAATGGSLPVGAYTYRVAAVGAFEGPEGTPTVATIAGVISAPVQSTATVTTLDSGIFGSTGTYFYKITATNAIGETVASNEISAVVAATTSSVTLHWAAVSGATGYKVYRGSATGAEDHLVGTVGSGATVLFKDTGGAGTAVGPPGSNGTATSTNTITLGWAATPAESGGYKVYRDGLHLATVAHGAPRSYVDDGSVTPAGAGPDLQEALSGEAAGGDSPKPADPGAGGMVGEGDEESPTEAAL